VLLAAARDQESSRPWSDPIRRNPLPANDMLRRYARGKRPAFTTSREGFAEGDITADGKSPARSAKVRNRAVKGFQSSAGNTSLTANQNVRLRPFECRQGKGSTQMRTD